METKYQVAGAVDLDAIYGFAEKNFQPDAADRMERTIALWNVPWRSEALEHYLKLGWSFKALRGNDLCGFFTAQPFLFFRGATQSLWVESVLGIDAAVTTELCAIAVGVAREKHFQHVLFADADHDFKTDLKSILAKWNVRPFGAGLLAVPTTKN